MPAISINMHVAISAVMLTACILQTMLVVMVPELRRRWWSAAITFLLAVYALSLVVQMVSGRSDLTVFADRLTFASLIFVAPLLHGMVQTYIGSARRRWLRVMIGGHLLVGLATLFTSWIAVDSFRLRRTGFLSPRFYWEADAGPLQLPLIGYLFVVVTLALVRWARYTWRNPSTPRWYLFGFLVWYLMAVQNAVVNAIAPQAPGLLAWGFVVFALFTLATTVAEMRDLHRRASHAEEQTTGILRASAHPIAACGPELRVRYANPAFTALVGEDPGAGAVSLLRLFSRGDHAALREAVGMAIARAGEPHRLEATVADSEGGTLPVECTLVATGRDSGEGATIVLTLVDLSEHKTREAESRYLALHDPLTRLPNRLALEQRLEERFGPDALRRDHQWALLLLDIDAFKAMNDSHGHDFGDLVLVAIAQRIATTVRAEDHCFRLGGDEFVVLTGDVHDAADALRVAERIAEAIAHPVSNDSVTITPHASVGVALFPSHARDAVTLMKRADLAMYRAKDRGVPVCLFRTDIGDRRRTVG